MAEIVAIDTPSLGDRSYLVHDGQTAFVVDPQRDIDRMLAAADRAGVRIRHVFETHLHNDYVTGGYALAAETGAAYHVNAGDPVAFRRVPVRDGDVVEAGNLRIRAAATPGHTFTHLAYVLEEDGRPTGVFTGGSLLYGSVGRPDLLGVAHTDTLARLQYRSVRRLAEILPDPVPVYPTHGFGSFCAVVARDVESSTVGRERRVNPALTLTEPAFLRMLAGLGEWPAYYAHMGARNAAGPAAPDLSPPPPADPTELRRRRSGGEWVVDLRHRTAFAACHVRGTYNVGLDGDFATTLGWLMPWGTPVTLLGETERDVACAQRELVRIGVDRPAAAATGSPERWAGGTELSTYRRATFADLAVARAHTPVTVLDVRRRPEWCDARLAHAVHVPLHELAGRLGELPDGDVWVHCAGGYRAAVAASILAAAGRPVVAVDDDFTNAGSAGLPVVTGPPAS